MSGAVEPFETIEVETPGPLNSMSIHMLTDGRLLVSEIYSCGIQLFDSCNKCIARAEMAGLTDGVAIVNGHECVVRLRTLSMLQFLAVGKDSLVPGKKIWTDGEYWGVVYCQNQLIVADVCANRIKVLNMEGRVLSTIGPIFAQPCNIAANQVENVVYVADYKAGTVTCMTMEGTVLSVYKRNLIRPLGITVHPDGTVYVCDPGSHSIHHIASQCTYIETVLSNGEVGQPQSVCFNPEGDRMYISEHGGNPKVYRVYTIDKLGKPSTQVGYS